MHPDDELPRLHGRPIDPAALAEEGEPFADLVTRHGGKPFSVPLPNGWRVLARRGEAVDIGAPLDADRRLWQLASVRPGEDVWFIDEPENPCARASRIGGAGSPCGGRQPSGGTRRPTRSPSTS